MKADILIVDDEKEIADLVALYLQNEGCSVHVFDTAAGALACVGETEIDLAVLDVMLPDMDGFSLCKAIRESHTFPIIMLTAKVEDMDKLTGLAIGADDYITKPFNPLEVVARVKAQLRRCTQYNGGGRPAHIYDKGGLIVNRDTHECSLYGKMVPLTPIEFDILWLLCENDGKVVSAEDIFEQVWGEKYLDSNNTVMVHIRRLREKLKETPRNPKYIKTVWGVGYKIESGR